MPTARERMLELSPLPSGQGYTARQHFIAIQLGAGNLCIYGESTVEVEGGFVVSVDDPDLKVVLAATELDVAVDLNEFEVECE